LRHPAPDDCATPGPTIFLTASLMIFLILSLSKDEGC
jgi:hypothetical protein